MHELHLMKQVVKAVEAELHGAEGVMLSVVRLKVNTMSHLLAHDPASLQATFQLAARGTRAEGAAIEIIPVPGEAWCPACKSGTVVRGLASSCSACGGPVVAGLEEPEVIIHELIVGA